MRIWPKSLRFAFALSPEALDLLGPMDRPGPRRVAHVPLPAGCFGPTGGQDNSRYEISDEAALVTAIRQAVQQAGKAIRLAHLAMDGCLIRQLNLPIAFLPGPEELKLAVQTEAERYVVFNGAEIALASQLLGQEGDTLSVVFAAMRQDLVDQLVRLFAQCGIRLESIEPASFALARHMAARFPELAEPEGGQVGIVALLPNKLDVSAWENGKLRGWRRIFLDSEAVRREDPSALTEAQFELQRTLTDMPARRWLISGAPEALAQILLGRPDSSMDRLQTEETSEVVLGAAARTEASFPFDLNLLIDRNAPKPSLTPLQLAVLGGVGLVMLVALAVGTILDAHARQLEAELERSQDRATELQASIARASQVDASTVAARTGMERSLALARIFASLRDVTPANAWLSEIRLSAKGLSFTGVSLDRSSPLRFAQALGAVPGLANVSMPELSQTLEQDTPAYHFRLEAALDATGSAR